MSRGDIPTNNESFNSDDENYENGDDAYPEYGEVNNTNDNNKQPSQLWNDQIRQKTRKGRMGSSISTTQQSFEMVPLSDSDDNELDDFNYDNEEEDDDDDHIRRNKSTIPLGHPHSGDDYTTSQTRLPKVVYQYIYPPNVPRSVQLCRSENIAIPACYLLVGLLQGLSGPFTNVYPLDLNASEAQQVRDYFDYMRCSGVIMLNIQSLVLYTFLTHISFTIYTQATISSLKSLPSTFKLVFGFISDNVPLFGYRRKSYMLIGWAITSLSMFLLLFFSDLSMDAVDLMNGNNNEQLDDDVDEGRYVERQIQSTLNVDNATTIGEPPSIPFLSFTLLLFGTGKSAFILLFHVYS